MALPEDVTASLELHRINAFVRNAYVSLAAWRPVEGTVATYCEAMDALEHVGDLLGELNTAVLNQRL